MRAAEVGVQDRATLIPLLPKTLREAEAGYERTRADIDASVSDIETELRTLRASEGIKRDLRIPPAHMKEVRYLAEVMSDETYLAQERAVLDLWNAWQTRLVETGVKADREGLVITRRMRLLEAQHFEWRVPVNVSAGEGHGGGCFFCEQKATAVTLSFMSVDGLDYTRKSNLMNTVRALADASAPGLARVWASLAMDLRDEAEELLDQERLRRPTSDPDLKAMRVLARIDLLERIRYALWLDLMVWSHLASKPLPDPPESMEEAE